MALYSGDVVKVPPDPEETLWVDSHLGLMGEPEAIARFCEAQDLDILEEPDRLAKVLDPQQSGIAEVVITPSSNLVGNAIELGGSREATSYQLQHGGCHRFQIRAHACRATTPGAACLGCLCSQASFRWGSLSIERALLRGSRK